MATRRSMVTLLLASATLVPPALAGPWGPRDRTDERGSDGPERGIGRAPDRGHDRDDWGPRWGAPNMGRGSDRGRSDPDDRPPDDGRSDRGRFEARDGQDMSVDEENQRHEREMSRLERKLEEAERSDNQRKVRALEWQIGREKTRHEEALARIQKAQGRPRVHRGESFGRGRDQGEGPPDRLAGWDRDRRDSGRGPDRGRWRDDAPPWERSRAGPGGDPEEEVSNPLREEARRRGDGRADFGPRYRGRYDADEDDGGRGWGRPPRRRGTVSDRVRRAEGPIRRRW